VGGVAGREGCRELVDHTPTGRDCPVNNTPFQETTMDLGKMFRELADKSNITPETIAENRANADQQREDMINAYRYADNEDEAKKRNFAFIDEVVVAARKHGIQCAAVGAVVPFYDDEGDGCINFNTFNIGDILASEAIIARMHRNQCQ
jgi:hypothetical protein